MQRVLFITLLIFLLPLTTLAAPNNIRITPLKGTVTLVFDDGPSPVYTPQVLAILKKYHVKATFFMVGVNAKKYPEIVKMVQADGHVIGNHSLTHEKLTKLSDKELDRQVAAPQMIIYQITGEKPVCLHYPFGMGNARVRAVIRSHDMMPVPMAFNSFDYEHPGVDKIVSWVVQNAVSGRNLLLHDGYTQHEQTVAALPRIIEGIRAKGLGFSTICEAPKRSV